MLAVVKCDKDKVTEPVNGKFTCTHKYGDFSYNSLCQYSCEQGYRLSEPTPLRCTASKEWSAQPPTCERELRHIEQLKSEGQFYVLSDRTYCNVFTLWSFHPQWFRVQSCHVQQKDLWSPLTPWVPPATSPPVYSLVMKDLNSLGQHLTLCNVKPQEAGVPHSQLVLVCTNVLCLCFVVVFYVHSTAAVDLSCSPSVLQLSSVLLSSS